MRDLVLKPIQAVAQAGPAIGVQLFDDLLQQPAIGGTRYVASDGALDPEDRWVQPLLIPDPSGTNDKTTERHQQ